MQSLIRCFVILCLTFINSFGIVLTCQAQVTIEETVDLVDVFKPEATIVLPAKSFELSSIKDVVIKRKKEKKISSLIAPDYIDWDKNGGLKLLNLKNVTLEGTVGAELLINSTAIDHHLGYVMGIYNSEALHFENITFGYIKVDEKIVPGLLKFDNSNNIQVINCDFTGPDAISITLNNCKNISLINCRFSSPNAKGIELNQCSKVRILNCHFSGSEARGIRLNRCSDVEVKDSVIESSWELLKIYDSNHINISDTRLEKGVGTEQIVIGNSRKVIFNRCIIADNRLNDYNSYIIFIDSNQQQKIPMVQLRNCTIRDNQGGQLSNHVERVKLINCALIRNQFDLYEKEPEFDDMLTQPGIEEAIQ